MPVRQRLSTTEEGKAVLVKHAPAGAEAERLAEEAAVLRSAAHPGVVELVAERHLAHGAFELMLVVAGSRTAADVRTDERTGLVGVAGLVASLATTVADLHDLGVAHRRIGADHVVIDGSGRPVLCGFGAAVRAEPGALSDADRAADVAGLGGLLRHLLSEPCPGDGSASDLSAGDWEPIPTSRFRRGDRWTGYARRALLNVADQATADDPANRPTARRFAAAVLAALPEARLPGATGATDVEPVGSSRPPWPRRRFASLPISLRSTGGRARPSIRGVSIPRPSLPPVRVPSLRLPVRLPSLRLAPAAAAVGLGLLVFGIGGLLRPPAASTGARPPEPAAAAGGPARSREVPPGSATTVPDVPVAAGATGTTGTTGVGSCAPVPPPAADPDGDGCPSPVAARDGVVQVGGVRYSVGAPGDLVAVGDWDCDGAATVALVRRPGGEVFVFEGWAAEGADLLAEAVATVADAVAAEPVDVDGDGCPVLVVVAADGTRTEVPT